MNIFNLFKQQPKPEAPQLILQTGEKMVVFEGLGMHCMGCRALVESELHEITGVHQVDVNLERKSATVIFDPTIATVDIFKQALHNLGYAPQEEVVTEG